MLVDLTRELGNYLHEVFVMQLDWWVALGFVAQLLFTGRFLVQWIASEKQNRMVIPIAFWFFSIGGGILLLIYAIHRRDPVLADAVVNHNPESTFDFSKPYEPATNAAPTRAHLAPPTRGRQSRPTAALLGGSPVSSSKPRK